MSMTITDTYEVFEFSELSDSAKDKARQDFAANLYHEWWDGVESDFIYDMGKIGFNVDNTYFSGFYSQGDGACFIGSVDVVKFLKSQKITKEYWRLYMNLLCENAEIYINIEHHGHYYHRHTMQFNVDFEIYYDYGTQYDEIEKQGGDLIAYITEFAKDKALEYYRDLKEAYDYLLSDEHMLEMSEANEYWYHGNGELA